MPKNLWFKKKKYGWGWTPANRQGWLVVLGYILALGIYPILGEVNSLEFSVPIFLVIALVLTVALIWICYKKGEKPSWNWGD